MKKLVFIVVLSVVWIFAFAQEKETPLPQTSAAEEFRVKREEIFEFVRKPQMTKNGENIIISFESKGFCDATIAIENAEGKILRHLASGVLGPKAPAPFLKNSKIQKIIWDGKDDQERYLKESELEGCQIRVSLGLKPQFERTMYWSPKKRLGYYNPAMCAAPEGVYVAETQAIDQVRLFDHQGNYIRTIYPFPSDQLSKVNGLKMHTFIQDGKSKPVKRNLLQATLLTSSDDKGHNAPGISAITAINGKVAVAGLHLNRLAADGSSGGQSFYGPEIGISVNKLKYKLTPRSMAFSPDGKWLYLTGYGLDTDYNTAIWLNAITRMPYDESQPPTLWVGDLTPGKHSSEEGKLRMPTSVACDTTGRVYVSEFMNDRIQVFSPEGKHLKSIPVNKPAYVALHQKTNDIFVFSFNLSETGYTTDKPIVVEAVMVQLGSFENPIVKNTCPLPLSEYTKAGLNWDSHGGFQHLIQLDSWAEKPTVWIINGKGGWGKIQTDIDDGTNLYSQKDFAGGAAQLYEVSDNKLVLKHSFADDIRKAQTRMYPTPGWIQPLSVNPITGKLYVYEMPSRKKGDPTQLIEISPESGEMKMVNLPIPASDFCFDRNGLIYIRTHEILARFDPQTLLEIPFDYGIEKGKILSAISVPGHKSPDFHRLGGIDVSSKGNIVVTTCALYDLVTPQPPGVKYIPPIYPGRMRWGETHIWDKHGKLIHEDVTPGMGHLDGIRIDKEDNLYMLTCAHRVIDGKQTDPMLGLDISGTLIKVTQGKNKTLSPGAGNSNPEAGGSIPLTLPKTAELKRSIDIKGMTTGWVEGAEWFYGGIGFCNPPGLIDWYSSFTMDYFNRSFAPENQNFSVAVLDSNGNLILRIGKYGNVEDGKPLIADGGPKETKSIGGDEVGLFWTTFLASHTDKRLFIADAGNTRIISVKLGYNTEEKILIKNIKNKN